MKKTYAVNEIFYSLQGEGIRAGTANLFLRFAGCNLKCDGAMDGDSYQPVCDTEFVSSRKMSLEEIYEHFIGLTNDCKWIIMTGGEPGLQVDADLITFLKSRDFKLAVETNGSMFLPAGIDWITVSPKVAEHAVKQLVADEVKYVRAHGQGIPKPTCRADHKLLSPAFEPGMFQKNLEWCIKLCKENPEWRLSVQQHKTWNVR